MKESVCTGVVGGTPDELAAWLVQQNPDARTASLLAALDPDELSPAGRIDALKALQRHGAWILALQLRMLAALEVDPVDPAPGRSWDSERWDATCEQVACALRITSDTAAGKLETARRLTERFPSTLRFLEEGRIHFRQAEALCDITATLDASAARQVESMTVGRMPEQACSATRKALHRAVLKADPAGAEARHRAAREDRKVCHRMDENGMAWWSAFVPAEQAARMDAAVDEHAEAIRTTDDRRTLPQRRADALVDLVVRGGVPLNGTSPGGRSAAVIHVTVPFDTLIGVDDAPGEVKGYGPLTAGQIRALAFDKKSTWRRLLVHPKDGTLVKADPTTYKPTADVERHVIARDRSCQFPSCRMPAHRCDLDHIRAFDHTDPRSGGPSTPENLMPLCRRHHRLKHRPGWSVHRDSRSGTVRWTTPTGHTYVNRPYGYAV